MWGLEKGMYGAVALFVFCTFFLSLFLFGGTFKMWEVESFVGGSIRLILKGDLRTILCPIDGQSRLKLTL